MRTGLAAFHIRSGTHRGSLQKPMETFCGIGSPIVLTFQTRAQLVFSQFLCQESIVKSIIKVAVQSLASDTGVSQLAMFKKAGQPQMSVAVFFIISHQSTKLTDLAHIKSTAVIVSHIAVIVL